MVARGRGRRSSSTAGDETGVGSHSRLTWRSKLPYDLVFEATTRTVEKPRLIEADAVGELTGTGRWRLFEQDGVTAVLYEWNVHYDEGLDERARPAPARVFDVEPQLGDAQRRHRDRRAARLRLLASD